VEKKMARIIHFEIPAADPERAAAFYKKVFDWQIEKWPGPMEYWMVTTGAEGSPGHKWRPPEEKCAGHRDHEHDWRRVGG
jgi:predicted enzyme related to lactoylglutathione lyase